MPTPPAKEQPEPTFVYVGSYTADPPGGGQNNPVGFAAFRLDETEGQLTKIQEVASHNPSWLAVHPTRRFLLVLNEQKEYAGQASGAIASYAIDPNTGEVAFLNRRATHGADPAHCAISPEGDYVLIANYNGANLTALPIAANGFLGKVCAEQAFIGHGSDPVRQEASHPHGVTFAADGNFCLVTDLGLDRIYSFKKPWARLALHDVFQAEPGVGPRHLVFHPTQDLLYVINELAATISVIAYERATGRFGELQQSVATEALPYVGEHLSAAIALHPSGKFLYASNRGQNSVACFALRADGWLEARGHVLEGLDFPRHLIASPCGQWLYVANQKSSRIVRYRVDPQSGALSEPKLAARFITPVALVFG